MPQVQSGNWNYCIVGNSVRKSHLPYTFEQGSQVLLSLIFKWCAWVHKHVHVGLGYNGDKIPRQDLIPNSHFISVIIKANSWKQIVSKSLFITCLNNFPPQLCILIQWKNDDFSTEDHGFERQFSLGDLEQRLMSYFSIMDHILSSYVLLAFGFCC